MFSTLQDPARQWPFGLTPCDQKDSLASATNHGGPFLQTELPLVFGVFEARPRRQRTGRCLMEVTILIQNGQHATTLRSQSGAPAPFIQRFIKTSQR